MGACDVLQKKGGFWNNLLKFAEDFKDLKDSKDFKDSRHQKVVKKKERKRKR